MGDLAVEVPSLPPFTSGWHASGTEKCLAGPSQACASGGRLEGLLGHRPDNPVLALDTPAGPSKYKFAKDADVTVVFYTERTVKANHTFKAGELTAEKIDEVLKDVSKITPAAK